MRIVIIKDIDITAKGKDSIVIYNKISVIKDYKIIKIQQDKSYINNIDIINIDVIIEGIEYIMLTRKVKTVIKDWWLEFINRIQHKEIIKITIKQEPYIKV